MKRIRAARLLRSSRIGCACEARPGASRCPEVEAEECRRVDEQVARALLSWFV